ncbi:MAG: multidrug ABC transporter ATPase, partial [Rothia mucilaginosa]
MWLPYLEELAADEDHPRTVVAVVPHISESWHGARAVVGRVPEENVPAPVEGEIEPSNDSPEHGENAEKE